MATINPNQDYDIIHTLTFAEASGTCPIRLYRGSSSAYTGTVYYRAGTSGDWTSLSVSGTSTTFPITSTTMQIAHNWNKSGNNHMTPSFYNAKTITSIAISQKSVLTGTMGNYFMYYYARGCSSLTSLDVPDTSGLTSVGPSFMRSYAYSCSSLTSLDVPDTSGLTSVGDYFMANYAYGCSSLTSLDVPDTSNLTSVGNYFMAYYAEVCTSLTSLNVPDTSNLTSVGDNFMYSYAYNCSSLTSLAVPDTSNLTSVGDYFMQYYARNCSSLTKLVLPAVGWFEDHNVNWSVPAGRLGNLKGHVLDSDDLNSWKALTAEGKTLHTNYIRDPDLVYYEEYCEYVADLFRTIIQSQSYNADTKRPITQSQTYRADTFRKVNKAYQYSADTEHITLKDYSYSADTKRKIIQGHVFTGDTKRATIKEYTFTADTKRATIKEYIFTADTTRATIKEYTFTADTLRKLKGIIWIPLGTFWSGDWRVPEDGVYAQTIGRDRLELLRKSTYSTSQVQMNKTLYDLAQNILQDAGLTEEEYFIDPELKQFPVPYAYFEPQSHREALRKIAEACIGQVYCDRNGIIRIEGPSFLQSQTEPVMTITQDDYFRKDNPVKWSEIANYIEVETQPLRPDVAQEVYRSNEPISITAGQTKTITAYYNHTPCIEATATLENSVSGAEITKATYYAWGADITVTSTNTGTFELVINAKPLKVLNKEKAIAKDDASITDNGMLKYTFPANPLVQTREVAQKIADTLLAYFKNPRRDVEVEWRGNPALLLGDKVAVVDKDETNEYYVTKQELEFDGALRAHMSGRRA